jgi:hypothetical protein
MNNNVEAKAIKANHGNDNEENSTLVMLKKLNTLINTKPE